MSKTAYISLLDIIGPVMIGPSSSHTAGAARIGWQAYKALEEEPKIIEIRLFNSFSDTGKGHMTDVAVLGGCLGISPASEKIVKAYEIAKKRKIKVEVKFGNYDKIKHPNTAVVVLKGKTKKVFVEGISIGGGRIKIVEKQQIDLKRKFTKTNRENKKKSKKDEIKEIYPSLEKIKAQCFNTFQFLDLALMIESETGGLSKKQILTEFKKRWGVMIKSVYKGIANTKRAENNLFGGDGNKIINSRFDLMGHNMRLGLAFTTAASESNARMGKIVACPTAGSCGIIPGTFYTLADKFNLRNEKMAEGLVVAACFGAMMADKMELAGAVGGCQAEIGAAGAMAAAGGGYLLGGKIEQLESAASLVLANLLGLTCDPIMGLVQVPCILRNTMVASMVFAAIDLALAGVVYPVPFDEIVLVAKQVGKDMKPCYKETSGGGLAKSATACQICKYYQELKG